MNQKDREILENKIIEARHLNIDSNMSPFKIVYNNKAYYVRTNKIKEVLYEKLASNLAKKVGINCPECEVLVTKNNLYALIEDINNYGSFKEMKKLINKDDKTYGEDETLSNLWYFLEQNNLEYLMEEILKIYMFDILLMNFDRHSSNFGILADMNNNSKAYIFDNEYILNPELAPKITAVSTFENDDQRYNFNLSSNNKNFLIDFSLKKLTSNKIEEMMSEEEYERELFEEYLKDVKTDFVEFMEVSTSEHINLIKEIYDKITPKIIEEEIANIENVYGIKLKSRSVLKQQQRLYKLIGHILENTIIKEKSSSLTM